MVCCSEGCISSRHGELQLLLPKEDVPTSRHALCTRHAWTNWPRSATASGSRPSLADPAPPEEEMAAAEAKKTKAAAGVRPRRRSRPPRRTEGQRKNEATKAMGPAAVPPVPAVAAGAPAPEVMVPVAYVEIPVVQPNPRAQLIAEGEAPGGLPRQGPAAHSGGEFEHKPGGLWRTGLRTAILRSTSSAGCVLYSMHVCMIQKIFPHLVECETQSL